MVAPPIENTRDPRVERSRHVILRAALDELGEVGYGAFTIESVARRASVGKSTIYRHWPGKLALITDAFETFHEQAAPDLTGGSPREILERILSHIAEVVAGSTFSACIPALIEGAERDAELRRFHHRFQLEARRPLIEVIRGGVVAGVLPPHVDPQLAATALLGTIFYHRLMTREPFDPRRVGELLATVVGPKVPRLGRR